MEMKVEGLEELERTLGKLNGRNMFKNYLHLGAKEISNKAGMYPSETEANRPKAHGSWYERGSGVRYRKLDGSVSSYGGSEVLAKRWRVSSSGGSNPKATIFNYASYAGVVHGDEQAGFHADNGWKQLHKVAEEQLPKIVAKIAAQIDRLMR